MATKLQNLKWNLFLRKKRLLYHYGFTTGLIHPYEKEFIENLRHVYCGVIPGSILLLCNNLSNGRCYDRGLLATLGFGDDDFNLVDADIDEITLNPAIIDKLGDNPHYGNHCFAERTKKDGTVWVYDTSVGLVFEKNLYYKIQRPKITKINDKESTTSYCEYQDMKNATMEKDKYGLPFLLPYVERCIEGDQGGYNKVLKQELELFKQEIGYGAICEEVHEDMVAKGIVG